MTGKGNAKTKHCDVLVLLRMLFGFAQPAICCMAPLALNAGRCFIIGRKRAVPAAGVRRLQRAAGMAFVRMNFTIAMLGVFKNPKGHIYISRFNVYFG